MTKSLKCEVDATQVQVRQRGYIKGKVYNIPTMEQEVLLINLYERKHVSTNSVFSTRQEVSSIQNF